MKKLLIIVLVIISSTANLFAQTQTIYFNSNWEVTKDTLYDYSLSFDSSKKVENYQTFYKSGEVRSKFSSSELNLEQLSKSKFYGAFKEFAKNGKIVTEGIYENGLKIGLWKYYLDSGIKDYEETYDKGILNGSYVSYFDNNKIYQKGVFLDGYKHKDWISRYYDGSLRGIISYDNGSKKPICHECNEYQKCKVVVNNSFIEDELQSGWFSSDSTHYAKDKAGMLVSFSKEKSEDFSINLDLPWKNFDDFSFEVTFINTDNSNLQYGLLWNENMVENTYNQFLVTNQGTFSVDNLVDNVYFGNKFSKTDKINSGIGAENVLKIVRKEEKIYYIINGEIVDTQFLFEFEGSEFKIVLFQDEKIVNSSIIIKDFVFKDTEPYDDVQNGLELGKFNWTGSGSGFFIDKSGFVATNYHVIDAANEVWIKCTKKGESKKYKAEVVLSDKANDLSILKITDSSFVPLPDLPYQIASESVAVGNEIFTLGFPLADVIGETVKFTDGKVSSLIAVDDDVTRYQVSLPVQSGNSGGPLFDNFGNVVGVVVAQLDKDQYSSENVNYAVKSSFLKNLIDIVPVNIPKPKKKNKVSSLSQVEKIKLYSDYVVMVQIF